MNKKLAIIVLMALSTIQVITLVIAANIYALHYPVEVTIGAVEVEMYEDELLTTIVANNTAIQWGDLSNTLTPGTHTKDFWILNTGTETVELSLGITNLPSNWVYTWDAEGLQILSGESEKVTFTLTIPDGVLEDTYNFDSWVRAIEV